MTICSLVGICETYGTENRTEKVQRINSQYSWILPSRDLQI